MYHTVNAFGCTTTKVNQRFAETRRSAANGDSWKHTQVFGIFNYNRGGLGCAGNEKYIYLFIFHSLQTYRLIDSADFML